MLGNKRANTQPEVALRSSLHRSGMRFRKDLSVSVAGARVRPDIVFPRARLAVFVDGCFWHGCPQHGHVPRRNLEYWTPKLQRNRMRDSRTSELLRDAGWTVMRFWEHDDIGLATLTIAQVLGEKSELDLTQQPTAKPIMPPVARSSKNDLEGPALH